MTRRPADRGLVGVLLLLLVVVLVPTACVVWFMTVAMRNERAAIRQRLTAVYQSQLVGLDRTLENSWQATRTVLTSADPEQPAGEVFARLVRSGVADSVVVYDEEGRLRYPGGSPPPNLAHDVDSAEWRAAQSLEFARGELVSAADAYRRIARQAGDVSIEARALQAQARCLGKAGQREAAVDILTGALSSPRFQRVLGGQGRLMVPDSLLLALHLIEDKESPEHDAAADQLRARIADYGEPTMPAAQRRFLMRQLQELIPEGAPVDTFTAEDLAARYLESGGAPGQDSGLSPSGLEGVWQLTSGAGTVVALFHEKTIRATLVSADSESLVADVTVELVAPATELTDRAAFLSRPAGAHLPGWHLALYLSDDDSIDAAAEEQISAYLWTAALTLGAVVVLAFLIARLIGRHMRLTRLKNDLIATVSHELKTPLASMRLLVDTLLDGKPHEERQIREYLELISKENVRLSRLIEDFLAFSRMERNKQAFERVEIGPGEVAVAAADAVRPRMDSVHGRLDVEIASDLPNVVGDPEALATAIVNLLDNAYKYTDEDKHIVLRTYAENGDVCFAVEDNGIGLSRRATKRVFDRFYQADEHLSRSGGGVGLGLSIVKFIVDAHRGEISVDSEPGEGSTFTVRLPAVEASEPARSA